MFYTLAGRRYVVSLAVVFGLYVLAGKVGLSLASVHASVSAVWPPTGIALAALLTLGHRGWPAIFAGAVVVNATTAGSLVTSLGIAATPMRTASASATGSTPASSTAPPTSSSSSGSRPC